MRGDDVWVKRRIGPSPGSAPRARGRLVWLASQFDKRGISPACAGTTGPPPNGGSARWDQPRVRGDDPSVKCAVVGSRGSAPRARGRLHGRRIARAAPGISPACAGTTQSLFVHPQASLDQPRVRGDDVVGAREPCRDLGSAPRARGRRKFGAVAPKLNRISPACAGTTSPRDVRESPPTDQPRVRGDDTPSRSRGLTS